MVNLRAIFRNVRVLLMAASLGIPGWASAAEIHWTPEQHKDGFTVMVPSINMDALVDEMVSLKSELKHDETLLARRMQEKRMTGNDKVLSFLMPGGMLYAAYKKSAYNKAVRNHERVTLQLKEVTTDIVALTTSSGPIAVAQR
ncbi:MAG: hypothetical protein PVH46_06425 [Granulosicoccaceae bacterium]|jgi:hypothetical protein